MSDAPVVIEAAINGGTTKARNPNAPRTPVEIAEDGLRCIAAGAAIVHNHNDDPVIGNSGAHDPRPYIEAWRAILAQKPDAILYPTMGSGGPGTDIVERYSHMAALAEAGVLGQGLIDAGSVNLGPSEESGVPAPVDFTYVNTFRDARHMVEVCQKYNLGPSISIFEPGFLRVALAYHRAGAIPPGALVKLYFGGPRAFFGLHPNEAGLNAYLDMLEGTGLHWSVAVLGGDVVECGLARLALERGGHVRVGLEDYAGPRQPSNVELMGELTALCGEVGRPVASCAEARGILGLPAV
jgi:uncharacterized protein (DUF849 family)